MMYINTPDKYYELAMHTSISDYSYAKLVPTIQPLEYKNNLLRKLYKKPITELHRIDASKFDAEFETFIRTCKQHGIKTKITTHANGFPTWKVKGETEESFVTDKYYAVITSGKPYETIWLNMKPKIVVNHGILCIEEYVTFNNKLQELIAIEAMKLMQFKKQNQRLKHAGRFIMCFKYTWYAKSGIPIIYADDIMSAANRIVSIISYAGITNFRDEYTKQPRFTLPENTRETHWKNMGAKQLIPIITSYVRDELIMRIRQITNLQKLNPTKLTLEVKKCG